MTISVVIPAYNEENMLAECLRSLQTQTRPADEIIVVDNNSTDKTAAIARQFSAKVIRESQQGIFPAARAGYNAATGDIIARCDADSRLPAHWLATIEQTMEGHPDISALTGPGTFYGTNSIAAMLAQVWYMYPYFLLVGAAIAKWPLFGSNCAFRRSTWIAVRDSVHADRTDIHDDIDLSVHFPQSARIRFDPRLRVDISARALRMRGMRKRYAMGFRSLMLHWPEQSPLQCWAKKIR